MNDATPGGPADDSAGPHPEEPHHEGLGTRLNWLRAAVLGANARTDTIAVPSVGLDGSLVATSMLIGPASEFVVVPAPDDVLEPEDPAFIRRLRDAAGRAGDARPLDADGRPRFVGADGPGDH